MRRDNEKLLKHEYHKLLEQVCRVSRENAVQIGELSLWNAVHLSALARVALDENTDQISPLYLHDNYLCCKQDRAESAILKLYSDELIDISSRSDPSAFNINGNGEIEFYIDIVRWKLTIGRSSDENITILQELEKLLCNKDMWPSQWKSQVTDLWLELALDEVLAYLEICLLDHHLEARFGEKTTRVFLNILERFPINKVYNFIWGSVKDAVAYQVRTGVPDRQAANSVVGICQNRAERALTEGWEVKSYRRNYRIPQSVRTSYFSNVVTSLGEDFFAQIPGSSLDPP
ncbi:hypothetical protein [Thiomicrospira sp.]|uniref:hypothetical protein n=1 Tax=Thiomicrospira sp. TaxID=935 RepID=UPI002F942B37